jgi:prepilin-type N-terminal cleavage/methylation domain-containing protein
MKIHRLLPIRRPFAQAFTLIELLVVIAIIALLAALSVGAFTMAMQTSSRNRSTATLQAIVSGLERYHEKNGEYPAPSGSDTQDFQGSQMNVSGAQMLYQAITGDGNDAIDLGSASGSSIKSSGTVDPTNKDFVINGDFIPTRDSSGTWKSKLNSTLVTSNGQFLIVDGFGHPFQYNKADVNTSGGVGTATTVNPNFDVWSYANATGQSDSMQSDLTTKQSTTATSIWIKNW